MGFATPTTEGSNLFFILALGLVSVKSKVLLI